MIEFTTYKDKPILILRDNEKTYRKLSFGYNKAKLIIEHMEAIEKFVREQKEVQSGSIPVALLAT